MHFYAAGPVMAVVFRTYNVFYKIEGVPGKKPQVTSVNCSPSDCLFRLPCTYMCNKRLFEVTSRIIQASKCVLNMQPLKCACTEKRVALLSTIA